MSFFKWVFSIWPTKSAKMFLAMVRRAFLVSPTGIFYKRTLALQPSQSTEQILVEGEISLGDDFRPEVANMRYPYCAILVRLLSEYS